MSLAASFGLYALRVFRATPVFPSLSFSFPWHSCLLLLHCCSTGTCLLFGKASSHSLASSLCIFLASISLAAASHEAWWVTATHTVSHSATLFMYGPLNPSVPPLLQMAAIAIWKSCQPSHWQEWGNLNKEEMVCWFLSVNCPILRIYGTLCVL